MERQSLNVMVNGSPMQLTPDLTIEEMLRQLELDPQLVAVEQNLEIVPKAEYSTRRLRNQDRIEIVHFVGGG